MQEAVLGPAGTSPLVRREGDPLPACTEGSRGKGEGPAGHAVVAEKGGDRDPGDPGEGQDGGGCDKSTQGSEGPCA